MTKGILDSSTFHTYKGFYDEWKDLKKYYLPVFSRNNFSSDFENLGHEESGNSSA